MYRRELSEQLVSVVFLDRRVVRTAMWDVASQVSISARPTSSVDNQILGGVCVDFQSYNGALEIRCAPCCFDYLG